MGQAIASTLALMSDLPTPIISVIIGQGGSEGALALGLADRILMMENAIYSVISPENAASIVYRDREKAEEMASALKLTALDCSELGVVDTTRSTAAWASTRRTSDRPYPRKLLSCKSCCSEGCPG